MISKTDRPAHRFWVNSPLSAGADIELPGRAGRHAVALRLREGDEITLFDGRGGEYEARLLRLGQNARAHVSAWRDIERESPVRVTLALGISASERMDYAIQKATELGVADIIPLATSRSVVKLSGPRAERRVAHWQSIAVAACEQCGRNRIPVVRGVTAFLPFVSGERQAPGLLLSLDAEKRLRDLPPAAACTLLIGAEGGLSGEERAHAIQAAFVPVRFGPRVLRTETAPLAVIAALQAAWGDC